MIPPDEVSNGLLLCSFHHVALDRGALGLSPEHRILVSKHVMRGMKQREATIAARHKEKLTTGLQWVIELYDAWGKATQADEWRARLEDVDTRG